MTGHNHYPWCTCGWCVGGGGGSAPRRPTSVKKPQDTGFTSEERRQASATLERLKVHSYSSCFVNPNASCPICGRSVFFYSNSNGSRVFFDELGPPWPKHPCTDNKTEISYELKNRPIARQHEEVCEIADAERISDDTFIPKKGKKRRAKWRLLVVQEVEFNNNTLWVLLEEISSISRNEHRLTLYATERLLEVGDFVSKKGHAFSFLKGDNFENIEVVDGQIIGELEDFEGDLDHEEIPDDLEEMRPSENRHFQYAEMTRKKFEGEFAPVLKNFTRKGVVGPKVVSHYLNATGRKTACGAAWTPRLAFFLISFLNAPLEKTPKPKKGSRIHRKTRLSPTHARNNATKLKKHWRRITEGAEISTDDLVSKLSRLGRVVSIEKDEK